MIFEEINLGDEVFLLMDRDNKIEIKSGIIAEKIESIDGNMVRVQVESPSIRRYYADPVMVELQSTGSEAIKSLADTLVSVKKSELDSKVGEEKSKVDDKVGK